jgi:hypothetical protein
MTKELQEAREKNYDRFRETDGHLHISFKEAIDEAFEAAQILDILIFIPEVRDLIESLDGHYCPFPPCDICESLLPFKQAKKEQEDE